MCQLRKANCINDVIPCSYLVAMICRKLSNGRPSELVLFLQSFQVDTAIVQTAP
jgi:hypothetical protein